MHAEFGMKHTGELNLLSRMAMNQAHDGIWNLYFAGQISKRTLA